MRRVRVLNIDTGEELAARADVANTFWTRGKGLLGRKTLPAGEGLLLEHCNQVHMFFMSFPLDVVHVKRLSPTEGQIARVVPHLKPWRVGPLVWGSDYVIELPAGTVARTASSPGHRLALQPAAEA